MIFYKYAGKGDNLSLQWVIYWSTVATPTHLILKITGKNKSKTHFDPGQHMSSVFLGLWLKKTKPLVNTGLFCTNFNPNCSPKHFHFWCTVNKLLSLRSPEHASNSSSMLWWFWHSARWPVLKTQHRRAL